MGRTPKKKGQKHQDIYNIYSQFGDLQSQDVNFLKTKNNFPKQKTTQLSSKVSSRPGPTLAQQQKQQPTNRLFILNSGGSTEQLSDQQMNQYIQQQILSEVALNKNGKQSSKSKKRSKKKKNQDLIGVCEDSIELKRVLEPQQSFPSEQEQERIQQINKQIEDEYLLKYNNGVQTLQNIAEHSDDEEERAPNGFEMVRSDLESQANRSEIINQNHSTYINKSSDLIVPHTLTSGQPSTKRYRRKDQSQEKSMSSKKVETKSSLVNLPYIRTANGFHEKSNRNCANQKSIDLSKPSIKANSPREQYIQNQIQDYQSIQSSQKSRKQCKNSQKQDNLPTDLILHPIPQRSANPQNTSPITKLGEDNRYSNFHLPSAFQKSLVQEEICNDDYEKEIVNSLENLENLKDELNNTSYLLNYDPAKVTLDLQEDTEVEKINEKVLVDIKKDEKADQNFKYITKNFNNQQSPVAEDKGFKGQVSKTFYQPAKPKPLDQIICQAISVEPNFKRAIQRLGWLENNVASSNNFHIKFDITDKEGTYNKLKTSQWYNHFPSNREVTTKVGLCKNLCHQCTYDYDLQVSSFFPRCYDLSETKNIDIFIEDFKQTAILNIIKQLATHFKKYNQHLKDILQDYEQKKKFATTKVFKQQFKLKCSKLDLQKSGQGGLLGNEILRFALLFAKNQIVKKAKINRNCCKNRHKQLRIRPFSEEEIQMMLDYSQQIQEQGIEQQRVTIYDQFKTVRMHEKLLKLVDQYASIDGTANVWVVKPSYNARGVGVYCTNKLKEIMPQGKKVQSKVVQKYIENPFLVKNKKFDIRQWVLVTSWEPLDIYVFSGAYLKICSSDFTLTNLSDAFKHLSNFSVQKANKQSTNDDLVMSNDQFEKYVVEVRQDQSFSWKDHLFPKIQEVCYKTLKGVQESMEQKNNCFEIYGFDLILDKNLSPWVIEVNLSPACNERADYLTKMLDDMSLDLFTYLESKLILSSDEWDHQFKEKKETLLKRAQNQKELTLNLNDSEFYLTNSIQYRWMRIIDCFPEVKAYQQGAALFLQQNQNQSKQIELFGQKVDFRTERRIDLFHKKQSALALIQRFWRGFKARQLALKLRKDNSSLLLQRFMRRRLAQKYTKRLKENKAALFVQRHLRVILAKNLVKRMIAERRQKAKQFVAIKLQCHFRRRKAYFEYLRRLKNQKALIIQKMIRGKKGRKAFYQLREYNTKIIRIQKHYKRRFRMKKNQAIKIQKYLKGYLTKSRTVKLIKTKTAYLKLKNLFEKHVSKQTFKKLVLYKTVIYLQSLFRRKVNMVKYKKLLKEAAQQKLRKLFRVKIMKQIKDLAFEYNSQMNRKVILIQKYLRKYKCLKLLNQMRQIKMKNEKAVTVQRYLRRYLAHNIVDFRRIQLQATIILQSFCRMLKAKKKVKRLRLLKQKQDEKKQKELEKNFQSKKKVEKDIENYIESLFHKEIQQQKIQCGITPVKSSSKLVGGKGSQLEKNKLSRLSTTNLKKPEEVVEFEIGKQEADNQTVDEEENLILAESQEKGYVEDYQQSEFRQQKNLRIRKGVKAQSNYGVLTNVGTNKVSQNQANQKLSSQVSKVKTKQTSRANSQAHGKGNNQQKASKVVDQSKPKSFAENLMNMLAMQNIGTVFSEHPVEALEVLKQPTESCKRKNSAIQRIHDIQTQQKELAVSRVESKVNFSSDVNSHMQTTIETFNKNQGGGQLPFPKLKEFKTATNNIYLQTRPIQDPRQEVQFQQAILEQRLKRTNQQSLNNSLANQPPQKQAELSNIAPNQHDELKTQQSSKGLTPQMYSQPPGLLFVDFGQQELNQRPSHRRNDSHMKILKAYKNQQSKYKYEGVIIKQSKKPKVQDKSSHFLRPSLGGEAKDCNLNYYQSEKGNNLSSQHKKGRGTGQLMIEQNTNLIII